MNSLSKPKEIVVTGDVTIDWNLIFHQTALDTTALWDANYTARACPQPGGAAMLARLIEAAAAGSRPDQNVCVHWHSVTENRIHPTDGKYNHCYAIWEQLGEKGQKKWRVSKYLGIDRASHPEEGIKLHDDPEQADLVVLDDADLGFRDYPELWPRALNNPHCHPWVILKLAYPIANNLLLTRLAEDHGDRLIVVVTANDLRLANAQISRGLSWERAAQDTFWELSYGQEMKELAKCAHLVVTFKSDGAVLISRTGKRQTCKLFFDPNNIENGWESGFKGGMVGYNTCLTAAIVHRLLADTGDDPACQGAVEAGIQAGLSAMRVLHKNGYQMSTGLQENRISFPYQLVAADIERPSAVFGQTDIRDPLGVLVSSRISSLGVRAGKFTILAQQCCDDLLALARDIVRKGPERALVNIPLGRFGNLLTVDRNEIESYRTIAALVQEYINQEKADKPLSIAVFGAPGSGKSFGIKEIAKAIHKDRIKDITFNLSQMNSPDDLIGALHQVRDESLKGTIPLVFWDEFDTSLNQMPLGWLRYFLAPMQDGSFLEGQVTHPIGKAIFVFAGGTCKRMEEFGANLDDDPVKNENIFKAVKGPDFKSRLKGFINILGPNPQEGIYDPYFIIRRAILLESILRRSAPQIYTPSGPQIEDNLLDAFLETRAYRHGVRSMESIVAMSQLSGKTRFERSCLPPISQMNLHVIGWDFMARVQKLKFEGEALEKLAQAVHEDFCEYMRAAGYVYGPIIDETSTPPTHSALIPYAELPETDRIQNVQNALSIPDKLSRCGYVMIHARTNEPPVVFPDRDLDLLAEEEHNRWVKAKIAQDPRWHYAPQTNKERFEHNCLLPWNAMSEEELMRVFSDEERAVMGREGLPESEKEKDRLMIRRIPHILARVGYTVVKVDDSE